MTDRVERLTNLLAILLESPEPLTLQQLAFELEGQYPDGDSARRGAFERDKAALREIGVPIETDVVVGGEQAGATRYWIDRERYELRDLELDDDERRALQVALAATRPGSNAGQQALWKVGAGLLESSVSVSAVIPEAPELPVLREAISERRPVRFRYRELDRVVEPWGLLLRTGFWYLIGHDRGRGERRTYRIDRIAGEVVAVADDRFDRPTGFDPSAAFPDDPLLVGADPAVPDAHVRIDATRAGAVTADLGADRVVAHHPDGAVTVAVPCANRPAFRSWVLGYLEHAVVESPADVRDDVIAWLQATAGVA